MVVMSKKSKAFELFAQGLTAISPEVKALKLKSQTRYNYYYEWKQGAGAGQASHGSQALAGGESIGGVDETRHANKPASEKGETKESPINDEPEEAIEPEDELDEIEEAKPEEPTSPKEAIGQVSESVETKGKDGKPGKEVKLATTIADDGIKCTVFLSLQTLALFRIAATTQAQIAEDGDGVLLLGDFLDTCAEDFFEGRGQKLGLIRAGGK